MGAFKNGSQFLADPRPEFSRRGPATTPSRAARAILESATHLITTDGWHRDRPIRLECARERWVNAHPGREVVVVKGANDRYIHRWVAVFIEDDKGILSVGGVTQEDALERAFALLDVATFGNRGDVD